jgi:hypothetical protein
MRLQMRSWQKWLRKRIIHVAGRAFVEGASTPLLNLATLENVHFATQKE